MIKLGEANLHALKNKRAQAEEFLQLLPKIKTGTNLSDSKLPAMALLISTLITKESELRELQREITEAELKLAVPNTQGTTLAAKVFAPDTPDGPAWWLILVLASLSGLLLASAFLFVRKRLPKGTTQAASEI